MPVSNYKHIEINIAMKRFIFAAVAASAMLAAASCGTHEVQVQQEYIYDQAPFPECHAGTIVEYPEGHLTVAFFGGTAESEDDVCIYVCHKKIGDSEWSAPVLAAQDSLHACWNPVLYACEDGRMLLFYKTGAHVPEWVGHVKTSYDGGYTWGEDYVFPEGMLGAIKNKPVRLPSGRVVSPSSEEIRDEATHKVSWTVHFEISDDDAKTWRKVGPVEADDSIRVIQPAILIHKDGTLQALTRSVNNKLASTVSKDQGETWSKLELIDFPNNNSGIDVVTLPDGRFVMLANPLGLNPGSIWGERYPLGVFISEDGYNWKEVCTLATEPVMEGYCYPSVIYGSDGALHIIYTWDRVRMKYARVVL